MVYEPGRPIEELAREMGLDDAGDIIKIASNENALGPSQLAVKAMQNAATQMHLYPDGGAFYLRRAIAEKLDVEIDEVIVGNGSNELLTFLSHVYLEKGTRIVMAERAFVVYRLLASAFQAETTMVPMKDFTHDLEAMRAAITADTKIVYVSNPNNPTGTMVDEADIRQFMDEVPDHVVVVFDEAYIELLPPEKQPNTLRYIKERDNVYVLRTFSKTYGLAGLRIGYALASKDAIDVLQRVRQPFNVNAMAQSAARAALADDEHVERTRKLVADGLAYLEREFGRLSLETVPSVANFMLVKVGEGRQVFQDLQERKIIVRPMDGYGLPEYVRVTVGTQGQNEALIGMTEQLIQEGKVTP